MKKILTGHKRLADFLSKQEHIKLAYLFGSVVSGKAGKLSDMDIAILIDDLLDKKEKFEFQLKLISDLTDVLRTDRVDLVVMNDAPLSLKFEIIKANYPLFVRDIKEKIDFEQKVLSRYLDRRYYEKMAASTFLKKVAVNGI